MAPTKQKDPAEEPAKAEELTEEQIESVTGGLAAHLEGAAGSGTIHDQAPLAAAEMVVVSSPRVEIFGESSSPDSAALSKAKKLLEPKD